MVQEPQKSNSSLRNSRLPVIAHKPSSRQESITKGTASSLAKSVHAQQYQYEDIRKRTGKAKKLAVKDKKDDTPIDKSVNIGSNVNAHYNAHNKIPHNRLTQSISIKKKSFKFPSKTKMNGDDASQDNTAFTTAENQQSRRFSDDSLEAPDISADELIHNRRFSELSSATLIDEDVFQLDHHHHHHHHHYSSNEDDIPNYMRRPTCTACNRNVKINSEGTAHKTSTDSSRRSSFSSFTTKSDYHLKLNKDTKSLSRSSKYSSDSNYELHLESPITSPVPTRKRMIVKKKKVDDVKEKWNELVLQQHQFLSMITTDSSEDLSHYEKEQYESILLETQAKLLQKLTTMVHAQPQLSMSTSTSISNYTAASEPFEEEPKEEEGWKSRLGSGVSNFMNKWIGIGVDDAMEFESDLEPVLKDNTNAWNLDILERPW